MGFLSSYAPSAKFAQVGDTVGGRIIDARMVQTSEYKRGGGGRPEYWENNAKAYTAIGADGTPNEPKAQLELTLETGVPDEQGETERRIFIKNKRQWSALKAAVKEARDRRGLLIGGYIEKTWTGTEAGEGSEDAKTWRIVYTPPAEGGTEIDDKTIYLVGGGTYVKGQQASAPVASESRPAQYASGGHVSDPDPVATRPADDLETRRQEALARIKHTQQSSPIAARLGIAKPAEEVPF